MFFHALLTATLALGAPTAKEKPAPKADDSLNGYWKIISQTIDGKPKEYPPGVQFAVKFHADGKLELGILDNNSIRMADIESRYSIETTKAENKITITTNDIRSVGTYSVSENRLTIDVIRKNKDVDERNIMTLEKMSEEPKTVKD